ncbi:hypothetical protein L2E82_28774 [Cichorium intybus]|uniref:Uncharacterized protein n=1 Tax=Cichorium intybus TaxID=13427 RepID=A0ACB9CWG6_CICIN|nr:hypothetical protein L2E82_28774 [Cichorium intybus]
MMFVDQSKFQFVGQIPLAMLDRVPRGNEVIGSYRSMLIQPYPIRVIPQDEEIQFSNPLNVSIPFTTLETTIETSIPVETSSGDEGLNASDIELAPISTSSNLNEDIVKLVCEAKMARERDEGGSHSSLEATLKLIEETKARELKLHESLKKNQDHLKFFEPSVKIYYMKISQLLIMRND